MIPIEALTCLLDVGVGLIPTLLFLKGSYDVAFVSSMAVIQGWRTLSEVLRQTTGATAKSRLTKSWES